MVNRIIIKNSGRVSAEYCEGFFVIGYKRERVSRSHPSERVRILIPPDSIKKLELCAMITLILLSLTG